MLVLKLHSLYFYRIKNLFILLWDIVGAEMIDINTWKCTICDYKGTFGGGDTISAHINGAKHIQAKKNKATASA